MDGVFHLQGTSQIGTPCLLTQFHGQFDYKSVSVSVLQFSDPLDLQNLHWSGVFIRNSISERQQDLLEKFGRMTGPEMFMRLAVSSYSGHLALERAAINQLQTAKLKSIPGEDVVEFTRMYLELSDIPRYGQFGLPADATVLYVTALSDSSVEKFRSYMNTLYNKLALG